MLPKGMVAVSVDYRIEYLHHSTPFDSFEDAKDAICWLRSHASDYQLDPDKIAVAGGSAGGHWLPHSERSEVMRLLITGRTFPCYIIRL